MDRLQRTGQGGDALVLVSVSRRLECQTIEIAQRVVRGGHDPQTSGMLARQPPTQLRTRATVSVDVQQIGRTYARDIRTPAWPPHADIAAISQPVRAELGVHAIVLQPAGQTSAVDDVDECRHSEPT